jgi:hypothetical protein
MHAPAQHGCRIGIELVSILIVRCRSPEPCCRKPCFIVIARKEQSLMTQVPMLFANGSNGWSRSCQFTRKRFGVAAREPGQLVDSEKAIHGGRVSPRAHSSSSSAVFR